MNRETAKALLPIIQAYAEGKEIQVRYLRDPTEGWLTPKEPLRYGIANYEHRIKPEPKEIYVNEYKGVVLPSFSAWGTKRRAQESAAPQALSVAVKYREVLDE